MFGWLLSENKKNRMEVAKKSILKKGFEFLNKLWHAGYKDSENVAEEETST